MTNLTYDQIYELYLYSGYTTMGKRFTEISTTPTLAITVGKQNKKGNKLNSPKRE